MLVTLRVVRVNIADGACSHTAIALCDLEATIRRNELETSTVVSYLWVKLKIITENAVPMEDLKLQKSEYGKKKLRIVMSLMTRNLHAFSPNHFKRSFVILCWKLPLHV